MINISINIEKLIQIINSCESYLQLKNLKNFINECEIDNINDVKKLKEILILKENELINKTK